MRCAAAFAAAALARRRVGAEPTRSAVLCWASPTWRAAELGQARASSRQAGLAAAAAATTTAATPPPTTRTALARLKVDELRSLLAAHGMPDTAKLKKPDLVAAAWEAVGGSGGAATAAAAAAPPARAAAPAPTTSSPSPVLDPVASRTGLAVTWLGTSSGAPTPARNVSSIAARTPGGCVLVDAGEGTAAQAAAAGIPPAAVGAVLITHLHGDHCFGLAGLLTAVTRARAAAASGGGGGAAPPVLVAGPPGLADLVSASLRLPGGLDGAGGGFPARVLIVEFVIDPRDAHAPRPLDDGGDPALAARTANVRVARRAPDRTPAAEAALRARAAGGGGATSTASSDDDWDGRARQRRPPPKRRADQAAVHAVDVVPGLQWTLDLRAVGGGGGGDGKPASPLPPPPPLVIVAAQLQHRVPCWGYALSEVGGGDAGPPPRKVVLLGDTCDSTAMAGPGAGADLLSHEATFDARMAAKARIAQHSTAAMAGAFAAQLDARALVLTHFSGRYAPTKGDTGLLGSARGGGRGGSGRGGGGGGARASPRASAADEDEGGDGLDAPPSAIRALVAEARGAFARGLRAGGEDGRSAMEGRQVVAAKDGFTWDVPRRGGGGE